MKNSQLFTTTPKISNPPKQKSLILPDYVDMGSRAVGEVVEWYEKAQEVVQVVDPLMMDLDGDGVIATTSVKDGVYFDHGNDGFMEASAWVGESDGVLAVDKNSNGNIDNGNEIFGDNYIKSDGSVAVSGFDALSDFDSNGDGVVSLLDERFGDIRILKGDGSLLTLGEAGVVSINLNSVESGIVDESGNTVVSMGTFIRADGSMGQLGDYSLQVDKLNSFAFEWLDETDEIVQLPDVVGTGTMYSLHQAMMRDESGELKELVESYLEEMNSSNRKDMIDDIIYKWADVESIDSSSRGENFDAKKLVVLEKFMGEGFIGVDGTGNPNNQACNILEAAYTSLVDNVYAVLESQTFLKYLYDMITIEFDEVSDNYIYCLDAVQEYIDDKISQSIPEGAEILGKFTGVFLGLGLKEHANYSDFYEHYASMSNEYKLIMDTADKTSLYGTSNADEIEGSANNEVVYAYDGNDTIYTRQGDDIVYGEGGKDEFLGGDIKVLNMDIVMVA